jgi:hypothetical protein
MTDLGASATLNGATRSYSNGIAFLDVQSGDTPQASISMGQTGTLVTLTSGFTWTPAAKGAAALWRTTTSANALFIERIGNGQIDFLRQDTSAIRSGSGTYQYDGSEQHALTWDSSAATLYKDGIQQDSTPYVTTWTTSATLGIGYDPTTSGREVEGGIGILFTDEVLTAAQLIALAASIP